VIYSAEFSLVGAKLREKSNRQDMASRDFSFFLLPLLAGLCFCCCRGPQHRLWLHKQRPKLSPSHIRNKTTSQKYRESFEQGLEAPLESQQLILVSLMHYGG